MYVPQEALRAALQQRLPVGLAVMQPVQQACTTRVRQHHKHSSSRRHAVQRIATAAAAAAPMWRQVEVAASPQLIHQAVHVCQQPLQSGQQAGAGSRCHT